jgi:hypothetical protein
VLVLDGAFWAACLVLVAAGAAKVGAPAVFGDALYRLLPWFRRIPARAAGRAVGLAEMSVGVAGLALGGVVVALVVGAIYAALAVVVLAARRQGLASCGCFGQWSAPPSRTHAVVNAISAAIAVAAATAPPRPVADVLASETAAGLVAVLLAVLAAVGVVVADTRGVGATVPTRSKSRGTNGRA